MLVNGVEYLDEDAELFPDGSVRDATLAHDTDIQRLPCAGQRDVVFFPGGRLRLAWLSRPTLIEGVSWAAGITYFHENGRPLNATLASVHEFDGVAVKPGARVTLDDDGRLLEFSELLHHDQDVCGLPCSAQFGIWLYPDGRPSLVTLAADTSLGGEQFKRGTELCFDDDRTILRSRAVDLDSGHKYKRRVFGVYEVGWN